MKRSKALLGRDGDLSENFQRAAEEVISAFSGKLSSGEPLRITRVTTACSSPHRSAKACHKGLLHVIKVLLYHFPSQCIDTKMTQKVDETTVLIFHSAINLLLISFIIIKHLESDSSQRLLSKVFCIPFMRMESCKETTGCRNLFKL